MKLMPYFLVSVLTAGVAVAAYDQLKADGPAGTTIEAGGLDSTDLAVLESRLMDRLGQGQPGLAVASPDARILRRLEALEARQGARPVPEPEPDAPASEGDQDPEPFMRPEVAGDDVEPTDDEVRRFRKYMERAEQMRRDERELQRNDELLARLEINLDAGQKKKLFAAQRTYRRKIGEAWRTAMRENGGRDGGGREAARGAMDVLREEFTTELTKFMSIGDAQKISENGAGMRGFNAFRGRDGGGRRAR